MKLRWIINGVITTVAYTGVVVGSTPLGDVLLAEAGIPPQLKPYIISTLAGVAGGTNLITAAVQSVKK